MQTVEKIANLDLTQVAALGNDILERINIVREAEPIAWSESVGAWVVTRHADVFDAYSGTLPLSNIRFTGVVNLIPEHERAHRIPHVMKSLPYWITNIDPPYHTRIRKLLTRAFGKKVIEGVRPFARDTIRQVLDRAAELHEVEFVNQVARAVTGRVIMSILGVPPENLEKLQAWSLAINSIAVQPTAETVDRIETAMAEMDQVFSVEIERRRNRPTGDFISEMVMASDGGDVLSDDEIRSMCQVTLIAGHDTTMNTMGLSIVALARHPAMQQYIREHPSETANSIMELMRYVAMSAMQPRIVSADFEWHGKKLHKGDAVYLMIAGANRDPRVFSNPDSIDMTRPMDEVMVFGSGLHHCIGHLLAKMQLGEFFPEFLRRFDEIEILDEPLVFINHLAQRGLAHLNVRLHSRQT